MSRCEAAEKVEKFRDKREVDRGSWGKERVEELQLLDI
jgi:hypothetical protein